MLIDFAVFSHFGQLLRCCPGFIHVFVPVGIVQPVILAGGALRHRVKAELSAVSNIFDIVHIPLHRFHDLPAIAIRHTRHLKAVFQQIHEPLYQLLVVLLQLFFVHVAGVFPEFRKKFLSISGQIIHHTDACCTQHIVVLAVHCIVDQAVDLAAIQKVSRKTFREKASESIPHAFYGHIAVLVLFTIPPM